MFCEHCGAELSDDAVFCGNCGNKVEQETGGRQNQSESNSPKIPQPVRQTDMRKYGVYIIGGMYVCVLIAAIAGGVWFFKGRNREKEMEYETASDETEETNEQDMEAFTEDSYEEDDVSKESEEWEYGMDDEDENGTEESREKDKTYDVTEGGIHQYSYIAEDCTWSEAFQKAVDAGGYLVRINSREEYQYIISEIESKNFGTMLFCIGGRRDIDGNEYYWVDGLNELYGEIINQSDYWADDVWMQGEPSFRDGEIEENCLDIYYYEKEKRWVWNDVPDDILAVAPFYSGKLGYIIEYEN